jgi:hypothetical protein
VLIVAKGNLRAVLRCAIDRVDADRARFPESWMEVICR